MNSVIPLLTVAVLALLVFFWSRLRLYFSWTSRVVLSASFVVALVLIAVISKTAFLAVQPVGRTDVGSAPRQAPGKVAGLSVDTPAEDLSATEELVVATDFSPGAWRMIEAYFRQDGGRINAKDIVFHGIGSSDIDSNAITSRTIQDGSVRSEDLADHLSIERLNVDESVVANRLSVTRDVVLGSTSVINWGAVSGSDSYGIRNNAGAIQFRSLGGTWADIGSGSGGLAIGDAVTSAIPGAVFFSGTDGSLSQDGANFFWDESDARLGVGTSAPATALDVGGVITATGGDSVDWNSAYGWGNHANAGYLAAASYTAADVIAKLLTVDGSGSMLDADTLDGHDTGYFQAALTNPVTGTGSAGYVPYWGSSSSLAYDASGIFFWDATKHYLGIGTAGPVGVLDVRGGTATAGVNGTDINLYAQGGGTGNTRGGNIYLRAGSGSNWPNGSVEVDNAVLFIVKRDGNDNYASSSSGSASPTATVSLQNTYNFDRTSAFTKYEVRNAAGKNQYAYFGAISVTGASNYSPAFVWGQSTGSSAYQERMRIDENGNLGIGTSSPSTYTLQTVGTGGFSISVNSPIFQGQAAAVTFGNASYVSTIAGSALTISPTSWTATPTISGLIIATSGLTSNGTLTAGANQNISMSSGTGTFSQTFTGTSTTGMSLNGNALTSGSALAIASSSTGLTGDLASFIVSGSNASVNGNALKVGMSGSSAAGTALNITTAGSSGYALRVNDDGTYTDSTPFVIDTAGNVGIGTTLATQLLHVAGSMRLTGGFYDASNSIGTSGQVLTSTGTGTAWTTSTSSAWTDIAQTYGSAWIAKDSNRNWQAVAMSADGTMQTAVTTNGQIYVSADSGNAWTAKDSNRSWYGVAMSTDGTKQTAVTSNGQIYVSADSGNTWTAKDSNRDWRGVEMSADGTKQTAVVYGGQIYVSTDSGNTWAAKDSSRNWKAIAMSSDGTKQTAVVSGGQIYVSADSGSTWTAKDSSRWWTSVAMSSDGTKQTATVTNYGKIYVSTDSGNTWTAKDSDRLWFGVAMSSDGTKQTAVVNGGQIYVSTDSGNTWAVKDSNRNWQVVAMSSDGTKQTAAVYGGQIYTSDGTSSTIISGRKIGIGTASPLSVLDVSGNLALGSYAGTVAAPLNGLIVSGNVGIGTSSVYGGQIYVSTDSGNTWSAKDSNRNWQTVVMSSDGTKQTAAVYGGQIYVSTDSGNTWTAKDSNRSWYGVAMSSDGTKQTAVVYSGQIYVSTDSGNTWTAADSSRGWSSVAMSSDGTKQAAVVYGGQIYVSTDSGSTWTAKDSSRQWRDVAMSADGAKQTAVEEYGQIYVSTDSGNTWTAKDPSRRWYRVEMSADGTKQTAVVYGGQIYVSTDSGNTWSAKDSNRNWFNVAMSSDGIKQTAVVANGQIYISDGTGSTTSSGRTVGIGTTFPTQALTVAGNINVVGGAFIDDGTTLSVPDYVFDSNYNLLPIDSLRTYISDNKHLPNIPDMNDISGWAKLSMQDRDMKLLEKIEENTLYTLDQQTELDSLTLKTDSNVTTLDGLRASVDTQLSVIGESMKALDTKQTNHDGRLTTLDDRIFSAESSLTDLVSTSTDHETRITALETDIATLKDENLALMEFFATFSLVDATGNLDLLDGKLTAKVVETEGLIIEVSDAKGATAGTASISPVKQDVNNDGKDDDTGSDGKTVFVLTTAVTERSLVYITPIGAAGTYLDQVESQKGFSVSVSEPVEQSLDFNWLIVEKK